MKPEHKNYCTHVENLEDRDILTRKLFDVNMRLFKTNPLYRDTVEWACRCIYHGAATEKEGYKKPHGWSGANAGVPFNIIAFRLGGEQIEVMINPEIIEHSDETVEVDSNCGSLTLDSPITIKRWRWVSVRYFTPEGKSTLWYRIKPNPGFTIQHEIEHNQGILINNLQEVYRT